MRLSLRKYEDVTNDIDDFRITCIGKTIKTIIAEYNQTILKSVPFNSAHEGWAVIRQKVDDLWDEIKENEDKSTEMLRKQAAQIGAMAMKFIVDIGLEEKTSKERGSRLIKHAEGE